MLFVLGCSLAAVQGRLLQQASIESVAAGNGELSTFAAALKVNWEAQYHCDQCTRVGTVALWPVIQLVAAVTAGRLEGQWAGGVKQP